MMMMLMIATTMSTSILAEFLPGLSTKTGDFYGSFTMRAKNDPENYVKLFKKYWLVVVGFYEDFAKELNKPPTGQVMDYFRRQIHHHGKFTTELIVSNLNQTTPTLMGGLQMYMKVDKNEAPKVKLIQLAATEDIEGFKKYLYTAERSFEAWKKQRDETAAAAAYGLHSQKPIRPTLTHPSQVHPIQDQYQQFPLQVPGMSGHHHHHQQPTAAPANIAFPNAFMGAHNLDVAHGAQFHHQHQSFHHPSFHHAYL